MKKITFLSIAILLAVTVTAQQFQITGVKTLPTKWEFVADKDPAAIDTIGGPVFNTSMPCIDSMAYYSMGPSGYLTGNGSNSGFSFLQCSQGIGFTGNGQVTGVLALGMTVAGGSGTMSARVFAVDASLKPTGTALGTSLTQMSSAFGPGGFVPFTFSAPVSISGNFAVSCVYPTTAGDTVLVFSTRSGCVDATKDGYAYVDLGGLQWIQYKTIMQGSGGMPSFDLFLFAIVNSTTDIKNNPVAATASVYPNPASDVVNVVSLNKINHLKVVNAIGQSVIETNVDNFVSQLNVSNLQKGVYFVQLETSNGWITKRLVVTK